MSPPFWSTCKWSLKAVYALLFSCVLLLASLCTAADQTSCPSLSPRVCSNSYPLSWWYYPIISPSADPFSFCPQSFLASGYFPMSSLFIKYWSDQSIGASASASILPVSIQGWFPLGLTGLISMLSKGLLRVFSSATIWKHQFFSIRPSLQSSSHIHTWPLEKP